MVGIGEHLGIVSVVLVKKRAHLEPLVCLRGK